MSSITDQITRRNVERAKAAQKALELLNPLWLKQKGRPNTKVSRVTIDEKWCDVRFDSWQNDRRLFYSDNDWEFIGINEE